VATILGLSCFYHDSAAAIIKDGKIIAATQEERFTRVKHDLSFPQNSVKYCLKTVNKDLHEIDHVIFYEKPLLKFERLLETYLHFAPNGFKSFLTSMPMWIKEKIYQKQIIFNELVNIDYKFNQINKINFCEHHISHAASAFYPSPFKESSIITLDGVGEWTTTSISQGLENKIKLEKEINFPSSVGLLFSAFTYFLGFKVNSGEYKVMGLAPYGDPKYVNLILDKLLDLKEDGSFMLNMDYFDYAINLQMTNKKFSELFNVTNRKQDEPLKQIHMDIAASIQKVLELVVLNIAKYVSKILPSKNLCLAGGVALNCVSNSKILKENIFEKIWIQPAAGDAGGAIGSALAFYYNELKNQRVFLPKNDFDFMNGSYLGPEFSNSEVKEQLTSVGAIYEEKNYDEIYSEVAKQILNQKAIGWFQGRMEFGPRSLGNRSILADPRSFEMQKNLNLKIKYRESFRPFAPSVLKEKTKEWFDIEIESPYMLFVADIQKDKKINVKNLENYKGLDKLKLTRSTIPSVTHVDYSARIQTVDKKVNEKFYNLINEFYKLSECPMLINTSFNVRGEPIVCTPIDAFHCFMGTELDILVCENFIMYKEKQDLNLSHSYKDKFQLD
jgi:carbamoyltransferase